ncbi:cholesterol transport system auxiliary component [Sulfitobacter marinus]|uniref:Cholesterol transport system auxiliary component n=1 Tax=Sulfitobacter marinus TaxID=394264 RepID=A0A1I6QRI9_9RHOB|nr:ABC-type transport auxiliary lipoprotein family protein [Sulfitobacter marinus]SFS55096.1 cholesterol transport system auxiliary component [Sulfitobacter marinus]
MQTITRRAALLGAVSTLSGCAAISSINSAAAPLDTFDLHPVAGSTSGGRRSRTLLVARPQASAALATDRIMIKPGAASVTYLPDARWVDELPAVLQSLLIRSISGTGRIAYVGRSDAGPIPDKALLVRIDAFEVNALDGGTFDVTVDLDLTLINDSNQRVVASRRFTKTTLVASDDVAEIVGAFQSVLNDLLPEMADWAVART